MIGDDRGQSIQVGAVLLFGILIIGLAFAQTVVVPAENESVEFNGYVETTEDLLILRNDVLAAGVQGGQRAQSVQTGVRYPSRAVLINPGPSVGSLRTTAAENVTVSGVEAVSGEPENVRGIWDTAARGPQNFTTQSVRFSPAYPNIDVPPVEVSSEGAYRLTDNGPVPLTGRTVVTGNRITLVTVEGDLRTSALTTSVAATPASVATRSVTLTGTGSEFTVTLPVPGNGTAAAATAWNNSTAAQSLRDNPNVLTTAVNGSRVDVTFDGSRTYELRLARVIVHDRGDSGVDADTEPQYLVPLDANGTEVPAVGSKRIAVEVRDRYNNPVEGVDVAFTADDGTLPGGVSTETVKTGSEGVAHVGFDIDDDIDTATLTARIDGEGAAPYNETTIRLVRQGTIAGTGTDEINPSEPGDIRYVKAVQSGSSDSTNATVTFNNTLSESVEITSIRFSFYYAASEGTVVAERATVGGRTSPVPGVIDSIPNPPVLAPGLNEVTFSFDFNDNSAATAGDFFIITVTFDKAAGRQTYFIAVRKN